MRFLITGASGLVGPHVAEVALKLGHAVRLSDVLPPPAWLTKSLPHAEFVQFDVRDVEACQRAAEGCEAVIHCAAVVGQHRAGADAVLALDVNVKGTGNLLEIARANGSRLLHLSTASLYGKRPDLLPLDEDEPLRPTGMYDSTKQMVEILITAYRSRYGTDGASIRPGYVYGVGAAIGEYFVPSVLAGQPVVEPNGADHPCDFTYVLDLAEALVAAAVAERLPETVYNVSGGVLRTRGELAEITRKLVPGAAIEIGPGIGPTLNLRGPSILDRARRDFGFVPRFSLEEGVADWVRRLRNGASVP
jgi:nucleoside-diphosphate-sugar epimerase